jgi:hypothetical protein
MVPARVSSSSRSKEIGTTAQNASAQAQHDIAQEQLTPPTPPLQHNLQVYCGMTKQLHPELLTGIVEGTVKIALLKSSPFVGLAPFQSSLTARARRYIQ